MFLSTKFYKLVVILKINIAQNAPEVILEFLKIQIFLWEHAPRLP